MRRLATTVVRASLGVAVALGGWSCASNAGSRANGTHAPDATRPAPTIAGSTIPEVAAPEVATPEVATPEVATPEVATPEPTIAAPTPPEPAALEWVALSSKVRVARAAGLVEFDAVAVLVEGFLEAYICTTSTREHESLFVFDGKASEIHAALLVAGLVPGEPGGWREPAGDPEAIDAGFVALAPRGPEVRVEVMLPDGSRCGIASFARHSPVAGGASPDEDAGSPAPPSRFVFAGSRFRSRAEGAERYLADDSGSLVGLVTFGDETIAATDVIPDQASVAAPIFEADPDRMPRPGTSVRIRIGAAR